MPGAGAGVYFPRVARYPSSPHAQQNAERLRRSIPRGEAKGPHRILCVDIYYEKTGSIRFKLFIEFRKRSKLRCELEKY